MKISSQIYLIILLLSSCFCGAQNSKEYKIFKNESGIIMSEGTLENGKPNEYWKTYHANGKLKTEGNRLNFELDSIWRFYDIQGYLTIEISYKKGLKNGYQNLFNKDSILIKKELFSENKKEGISLNFYNSGKIKLQQNFENNFLEGNSYLFGKTGVIVLISKFNKGRLQSKKSINQRDKLNRKQGVWFTFYKEFEVKSETNYLKNLKHGYEKNYKRNGSLIDIVKFSQGVRVTEAKELAKVGVVSKLSSNGTTASSGGFDENGVPHGIHRVYNKEGKVTASEVFKNGKVISKGIVLKSGYRNGDWKDYYENGQLKSEGKYSNGVKTGVWIYYYKNGRVNQKGLYINGNAEGEWNWYYKSGKLLRNENYIEGYQDGILTEYSDSGVVISKGEYVEGSKQGKWFYEVGDHKEIGSYKDDMLVGEWIYYYKNKVIMFKGSYQNDLAIGRHNYWYENGFLKKFGNYNFGKEIGDWYYYNSGGILLLITKFENGLERSYNGFEFKPEHDPADFQY